VERSTNLEQCAHCDLICHLASHLRHSLASSTYGFAHHFGSNGTRAPCERLSGPLLRRYVKHLRVQPYTIIEGFQWPRFLARFFLIDQQLSQP